MTCSSDNHYVIIILCRNAQVLTTYCAPFPQGDSKNNYSQTVCVRAFNSFGAFTDLCFATINVYPFAYNVATGSIVLNDFEDKQVDHYMGWLKGITALGKYIYECEYLSVRVDVLLFIYLIIHSPSSLKSIDADQDLIAYTKYCHF